MPKTPGGGGGVLKMQRPKAASVYSPHFFLPLIILPPVFPSPNNTPTIFSFTQVYSRHFSASWRILPPFIFFFHQPSPTVESICMWPPPISKIATPEFDASNIQFLWKSTYLPPSFWNKYLPPPFWNFLNEMFCLPPIFYEMGLHSPKINQLNLHSPQKYHFWTILPPKMINCIYTPPIFGEIIWPPPILWATPPPPRGVLAPSLSI